MAGGPVASGAPVQAGEPESAGVVGPSGPGLPGRGAPGGRRKRKGRSAVVLARSARRVRPAPEAAAVSPATGLCSGV